jgi:hypothetical protein
MTNTPNLGVTPGGRHKWVDSPHGRIRKPIEFKPSVLDAMHIGKQHEKPAPPIITSEDMRRMNPPKPPLLERAVAKVLKGVFKLLGS